MLHISVHARAVSAVFEFGSSVGQLASWSVGRLIGRSASK